MFLSGVSGVWSNLESLEVAIKQQFCKYRTAQKAEQLASKRAEMSKAVYAEQCGKSSICGKNVARRRSGEDNYTARRAIVLQTKCYVVNDSDGHHHPHHQHASVSPPGEKQETEKICGNKESETAATDGVHESSSHGGSSSSLGTLQFTVGYDVDKSTLSVSIICARNLPVKNATIGSSDPYVKLQLLPEKRQKVRNKLPPASNGSRRSRIRISYEYFIFFCKIREFY